MYNSYSKVLLVFPYKTICRANSMVINLFVNDKFVLYSQALTVLNLYNFISVLVFFILFFFVVIH